MQTVTPAQVVEVKDHAPDLKEFILAPQKYRRYHAGTFLQLSLDHVSASDPWPESRTFSMASAYKPGSGHIRLIIRKIGTYTSRIFQELLPGGSCTLKYAFGDMILPQSDPQSEIVCIAGGTGISPFLGFIEELNAADQIQRLKLLYSVRKEEDYISYNYLNQVLPPQNRRLFCTDVPSPKGDFRMMNIQDILGMCREIQQTHFYICGAPAFITFFRKELTGQGAIHIHLDEWE